MPRTTADVSWDLGKVSIGAADDPLEHEADRVADRVMRTVDGDVPSTVSPRLAAAPLGVRRACTCGTAADDGSPCPACSEKEKLRRSADTAAPVPEAPPVVHQVLRSSGQPLDPQVRSFMEPRFGQDFSHVRVHADPAAAFSAASIGARAYTVRHAIVFGAGQFRPDRADGRRLLAHELAHIVQQVGPHGARGASAVTSRLQRKTAEEMEADDEAVVRRYLGYPRLDIEGLALFLNNQLSAHNFEYTRRIFGHIPSDLEDNVAAEMVSRIDGQALNAYAAGEDGRKTLNVLYEAMITGNVSEFERAQSSRILDSMRVSKGSFIAQAQKPMVVYPIREQGFTRDCYSAFTATLLRTGKVRVEFTSVRIWECDMFRREVATFAAYGGVSRPIEFDPDTLVGVRLYDQGGQFAVIPAIALIDFANQLERKTLSLALTAAITGLTFGAGALGGGTVAMLEGEVAAGTASGAALWGARILLWADRVAAVLPVVTELADENRDWILEKVPGGEIFLGALDKANAITAYYGWARLGFEGFRFLRGQLGVALNARQTGGVPGNLSSSEKEILGEIDRETANTLQRLNEGEEALAKEAVDYVEKHPETIKGEPGKRSADVGEGHKVEEVPDLAEPTGIGCELHSPGGLKVPCPKGMGTRPAKAEAETGAGTKGGKAAATPPSPAKGKAPTVEPVEPPEGAPKTEQTPVKKPRKPARGSRLEPTRLKEYRFIAELKERYPKLGKLDIRPRARPVPGAPESSFEERMQTSQGKYSLAIYDGRSMVIELDGISPDGWVQEIKIEQQFHKVDDIVAQLRRQADFAEAYGLKGVEYSIGSPDPELVDAVEAKVARERLRNVYRIP